MKIITIATGSTGNCYLVREFNHYIVLDCGIKFEEITSHPQFPSFRNIDCVFCSHSHNDHSKALNDFKRSGCEIISYGKLEPMVQTREIGNWVIITFPVNHDVLNWGIILKSKITGEKLCYVTDCNSIPKIENVDHWLYEVNYIEAYIDELVDSGRDDKIHHNRFIYHNSLENAISYFKSLKSRPKTITLCHLSADNSNAKKILEAMSQFADTVTIARREQC